MNTLLALFLAMVGGSEPRATAKLALALGVVEAKPADAADYAPAVAGMDLDAGAALRTGAGVLALVEVQGGLELRIAPNTEVILEGPQGLNLKRGQVWFSVPAGGACTVKAEVSTTTFEAGIYDLNYAPRVPNTDQGAFTILHVMQGLAVMANRRFKQRVTTGYNCTVVNTVLNTPDPMEDPVLPTSWLNPILVARGPAAAQEVERRVRVHLSRLARVPGTDHHEAALKGLGEGPLVVLGTYLASPANVADQPRRAAAARVMAANATAKSATQLLPLLDNETPEVRVEAAKGLARLAGTDQGRGDAYWRGDDRAAGVKAWTAWTNDPAAPKK
jgi:hypothetical protein